MAAVPAPPTDDSTGPKQGGLVLAALILVAAVANLNLSVANVALPDIGDAFDASQTALDLVAVGYSLGLAGVGAVPRRGRRPLRAQADAAARDRPRRAREPAGGVRTDDRHPVRRAAARRRCAPGMAYPTTLALITALWVPGPGRTRSIALWSGLGGAIAALGPLLAGRAADRL